MVNFTYHGGHVARMSKNELDAVALEDFAIVDQVSGTCCRDNDIPDQMYDWGVGWTDTQGLGNLGYLRIFPRSPRAKAIWVEGQIRSWERHGLCRSDAVAAQQAETRTAYGTDTVRAAVAEWINTMYAYPCYIDAFATLPSYDGRQCNCDEDYCPTCQDAVEYAEWAERWGISSRDFLYARWSAPIITDADIAQWFDVLFILHIFALRAK
jgi:hypothetical protein